MNELELKQLIKGVVKEVRRKRHGGSGEHEIEDVEIDGQTIAKVITPEHMLKFDLSVEYDADPGCEGRYYGPPENCYPGEGASAELIDVNITRLEISPPKSQNYVEVNVDRLRQKFPQIYQAFHKIAYAYVEQNWDSIEEQIIESFDFDYDPRDEPDYDRD